ncbi:hypothetical protein EJ04DRAFT_159435 [Polyplosphaeria fusca]|uniref:Uncharacterized protein n=1 Tax=Polyplosphaeria fusca TaxID=682080 RepID=A0A9P4R404_9PLEO|nr:hypothetical protein EJ04DRAFT_159435 [Polyplosphaeria fusca]
MSLGALTTTFTPAPGCTDDIYGIVYTDATSTTHKYHSLGDPQTTQCYPPLYKPDAFYSPGLCPHEWTSACGSVEMIGTLTETRVNCCPNGYVCVSTRVDPWSTHSCSRYITGAQKLRVPQSDGSNTIYMETTLTGIIAFADDIRVRYREGDFDGSASTTASSLSSTDAPSRPTSSGTQQTEAGQANSNQSPSPSPSDSSLTKGAMAGIGVGVAVGVLVALFFVFLCIRRRRRRRVADDEPKQQRIESHMHQWPPAEMESSGFRHELGADKMQPNEMNGEDLKPRELDANDKR